MRPARTTRFALAALLSLASSSAYAAEVKLLKQPSSFPIVISQPGSYRLKGNLTVPDENTTAISVQADYVTIDLNGYGIHGPVVCSGSPTTSCAPSGGTGAGIIGSGVGVTVRNGVVRGMGWRGLYLPSARVENVTAHSNGDTGISAKLVTASDGSSNGDAGIVGQTVVNCTANDNAGGAGIVATTATGCTAVGNDSVGIYAVTVTSSTANSNAGYGISAFGGSVANSTAQGNGGIGIEAKAALGCSASANSGAQISAPGVVGHNVCGDPGGVACP